MTKSVQPSGASPSDKLRHPPNHSGSGERQSQQDGQLVTSAIVALAFIVVAAAGLSVQANTKKTKSIEAVTSTLITVHQKQAAFRLLNQRFATWPELQSFGVRLPVEQAVVKSTVTSAHWFLSLRHKTTGVMCSKTGELFDEDPGEHPPVCRDPGT